MMMAQVFERAKVEEHNNNTAIVVSPFAENNKYAHRWQLIGSLCSVTDSQYICST